MKCPNCDATLVYSPDNHALECRSCHSSFDVNKFFASSPRARAEEHMHHNYNNIQSENPSETYVSYICSNCGAELVGTYETSALGFCAYCSGENIISSRIEAQRPDRIIPFTRSKESCKELYMETINSMPFVPKELKDEEHINKIRGIYIPYNIYKTTHDGDMEIKYTTHDVQNTYHCRFNGHVRSRCCVPVDASSQFDDYIGGAVFPYDRKQERPFNEGYLSTYYIELPDAEYEDYKQAVEEQVLDLETDVAIYAAHPDEVVDLRKPAAENIKLSGRDIVLAPLYFLSYKNKKNVCYTVFPGTHDDDSIYADIPIDIPKYMSVVLAIAVAIWGVLSFVPFMPTLTHSVALQLMGLLSTVALFLHYQEYEKQYQKKDAIPGDTRNKKAIYKLAAWAVMFAVVFLYFFGELGISMALLVATAPVAVYIYVKIIWIRLNDRNISVLYSHILFGVFVAIAILGFIDVTRPIASEIMYAAMFLAFAASMVGFYGLIQIFNESCEHKPPQFTRQGGHNETHDL